MRNHLDAHRGAFDAKSFHILVEAFDAAWKSVETSGAYAASDSAESARAVLAKYIVDAVAHGERDHRRLHDGALGHLAGAPNSWRS